MKRKIVTDKNLTKNKRGDWTLRKKVKGKELYRVYVGLSKKEAQKLAEELVGNALAGNKEAVAATRSTKEAAATVGEVITRYRNSTQAKALKGTAISRNINALCNFMCTVYDIETTVGGYRCDVPERKAINLNGSHKKQHEREEKVGKMSLRLLNPDAAKIYRRIKLEEGVTYRAYEKVPEHLKNKKSGELTPEERQRLNTTVNSVLRRISSIFSTDGKVVGNLMSDDPDEGIYTDINIPEEVHRFCRVKPRGVNKTVKKKYRVPDERKLNRLKQGLLDIVKTDPEVYKAFKIAFSCGCRVGEIKFLMWEDIRREAGGIFIYLGINESSDGTKSSKERKVEIPGSLYEELLGMATDDDYVIGGTHQYRKRKLERDVSSWFRKQGWVRHQCLHEMRKYFGSLLAEKTQSLADVAFVLGHANSQTTHDYYYDKINKVDYPDFNELLPSPAHNKSSKVKVRRAA